jgi:hypothetical protein
LGAERFHIVFLQQEVTAEQAVFSCSCDMMPNFACVEASRGTEELQQKNMRASG